MDTDIRRLAFKQFFRYFRVLLLVLGVLFVAWGGLKLGGLFVLPYSNGVAPEERVYDYADVLTDAEEDKLRRYIASREKRYKIHIVVVTIAEDIEGNTIPHSLIWPGSVSMRQSVLYSQDWEEIMMEYADNFYDEKNFGYNKVHGDGVLLLDNWYQDELGSQSGSWLSTCGSVYEQFSSSDIDRVLDAVYYGLDKGTYEAYRRGVDAICKRMNAAAGLRIPVFVILLGPVVIAGFFLASNLSQSAAKDTTSASTYVSGGKPTVNQATDQFLRKNVVTRHIDTSSGTRSGGSIGGGGGHVSGGGVSHGGGGRRR